MVDEELSPGEILARFKGAEDKIKGVLTGDVEKVVSYVTFDGVLTVVEEALG